MMGGKQGIFRIASVKASSHAAHEGRNSLPFLKRTVGRIGNLSHTLDSGNQRLLYIIRTDFISPQNLL